MNTRGLLGYILFIIIFLGIFASIAYHVGIVIASLVWLAALSVAGLLYIAVYLITG